MSEHTATPWQQGRLLSTAVTREWDESHLEQGEYEESTLVCVNFHASDQGRSRRIVAVATHMDGNAGANAAFIVRAANSHAALVAALRSAIDCVDEQATVIQELRSGGLATVAIPGWYLDAKKLLEEVLR